MMRDIRTNDNHSPDDPAHLERLDLEPGSDDRETKLAEEMFERFLNPQSDKYMFTNCGNTGMILQHHCYEIDNPHSEQLTEELKQKTIALVLETLEAAEAVLFAKLSATILENTTITQENTNRSIANYILLHS
jgi:hypothetical protein